MRSSLAKHQPRSPMSPDEVKDYEIRYYNTTGGGILHPNEFAEMYVRQEVAKHLANKYKGLK